MDKKIYLLPEDLLTELLNYLSAKPYREVYQAIYYLETLSVYKKEKDTE